MLAESKSPLRRFGGRGQFKKMLFDGRVKFEFDARDFAPVFHVDLLHHGLEQRLLRLGRRLFEQLVKLRERPPDLLERDGVGHAVRQLPLGLGLAPLKLVALVFQFAEPVDEQVVVDAACLEQLEEPLALAVDRCQFLVDRREFLLERGDALRVVLVDLLYDILQHLRPLHGFGETLEDEALDQVGADGVGAANRSPAVAEVVADVVPADDDGSVLERVADAMGSGCPTDTRPA